MFKNIVCKEEKTKLDCGMAAGTFLGNFRKLRVLSLFSDFDDFHRQQILFSG
jgi:hypothetical protein